MKFNLSQVSNTPIKLQEYEIIHDHIRNHMVRFILPKLFPRMVKECSKHTCYPVIIGGTVIHHCTTLNPLAASFVKDLFSEDVDVKFVVTKPIESNANETIKAIDAIRMKYAELVVSAVTKFIQKEKFANAGWMVKAAISKELMNIGIEHIKRKRVIEVMLEYVNVSDRTRKLELPLMDMSLFTDFSVAHFHQYNTIFNVDKDADAVPIPFVAHNGILYADCNYAYYDTIRMMIDRGKYFEQKKSLFALLKLARYIIKFLCLYVLLKNKRFKTQVDKDIYRMYEKMHKTLKAIDMARIQTGVADIKTLHYDTPYVSSLVRTINRAIKAGKIEDLAKAISEINQEDATNGISKEAKKNQEGGGSVKKPRVASSFRKICKRTLQPVVTCKNKKRQSL